MAKSNAKKGLFDSTQFAVAAVYNKRAKRIDITFNTGLIVSFPPAIAQGLENANAKQLSNIVIEGFGTGLHFPDLDADILIPALLRGITGTAAWMASQMGKTGGSAKTERKASASRENGKLGGRPRNEGKPLKKAA